METALCGCNADNLSYEQLMSYQQKEINFYSLVENFYNEFIPLGILCGCISFVIGGFILITVKKSKSLRRTAIFVLMLGIPFCIFLLIMGLAIFLTYY